MTFLTGIDIGGTSVKIGFISEEGNIIHKWNIPTNKHKGVETIIPNVWDSIQDNMLKQGLNKSDMTGMGVGAPGFIDVDSGMIYEAVNIGWKNYHLTQELSELSGLPVYLANDANIAALGENWKGAGNNARDVIAITLGTGVGAASYLMG
ncbi:Glucokinase [Lentibacillus sp. JNUCC-1]|nr:Glucokinase [Lentibacillus sp. JNUCC-1]